MLTANSAASATPNPAVVYDGGARADAAIRTVRMVLCPAWLKNLIEGMLLDPHLAPDWFLIQADALEKIRKATEPDNVALLFLTVVLQNEAQVRGGARPA